MSDLDTAVGVAGKSAGLVADYGVMVMLSTLILSAAAAALWIGVRYYNRRFSGEYIHRDRVVDHLRATAPNTLRPRAEDLPDLRSHRFFTEVTRQMRMAEQEPKAAERDLAVWSLRALRDAFADLVEAAYANKDGLEAHFGGSGDFRHLVDAALIEVHAAVRYRLVEEFGFPAAAYAAWRAHSQAHEDLMVNMLSLACERSTAYDRAQAALDSQYAHVLTLRRAMAGFFATHGDIAYEPPGESSHSTMQAMQAAKGAYPAALFERSRKA